jgi:hypothetical protein
MNKCIDHTDKRQYVAGELALVVSTVGVVLLLTAIAGIINPQVDVSQIHGIIAVPDNNYLKPEPLERILFLTGVLTWPVLLFLTYKAARRVLLERDIPEAAVDNADVVLKTGLAASLLALLWLDLWKTNYYMLGKSVALGLPASLIALFSCVALAITIADAERGRVKGLVTRKLSAFASFMAPATILGIVLFSVYDLNIISHTGTYVEHLNAVLHAVAQVYNGKELLVDLPHQYGMYPHFLEPLFKVTGLTMISFTTVMGLLTGVALYLLYRFMNEISDNRIVARFGFCAVVYYGYLFSKINYNFDQYFQYHPIRFLFPAASIYLCYLYFKTRSTILYRSMFLLGSMAIYWNLDTGIVIFFSWILVLLYQEYSGHNFKNMVVHLVKGIIVFSVFSALFNFYLYLRYGSIPDYASFLDYQKIFYTYGYAMLPMKLFGPWNLVIAMYLAGIVYAIARSEELPGDCSLKGVMVFYCAILGTGLFAYYQGRSHDLNLAMVCYPAVIIAAIFCDTLLTSFRLKPCGYAKAAFCVLMGFFLFCSASLVKNVPALAADTALRLRLAASGEVTETNSRAAFVMQQTRRGGEMLILSSLSGIYYMVSGATCPIKIPGPTELFLKEDYNKICNYIKSDSCAYLIYDANFIHSNPHKRQIADLVSECFDIAGASADGSIFLLKKRALAESARNGS